MQRSRACTVRDVLRSKPHQTVSGTPDACKGVAVSWASAATLARTAGLGSIRLAGFTIGLGLLFLRIGNDQLAFLRNKTILALIFHGVPPSFSFSSQVQGADGHQCDIHSGLP